MSSSLYVGLMSGTSMDGIDAVLLQIDASGLRLKAAVARTWAPELKQRLRRAAEDYLHLGLVEFGQLDTLVGREFAQAAQQLLDQSGVAAASIRAIGSHGQTVLHQPRDAAPFTLQIGDPNIIAEALRLDVVADFRRRDVAAGGEGAPLMPAFHAAAFATPGQYHAVVNIGGIANVTLLHADGEVTGFDTGPGNCLLDAWARRHLRQPQDTGGVWAASGTPDATLLGRMLNDPYFLRAPPKSTGRETFSDAWLETALSGTSLPGADIQATLAELSARTIASSLVVSGKQPARVLICGGGAYNTDLMTRLRAALPRARVEPTSACGIDPQHVEAAGFAWLAYRYVSALPGNLPSVTGARHAVPLGALYRGAIV
jgi:anhydro-N-acetylmuramic acid kinase